MMRTIWIAVETVKVVLQIALSVLMEQHVYQMDARKALSDIELMEIVLPAQELVLQGAFMKVLNLTI